MKRRGPHVSTSCVALAYIVIGCSHEAQEAPVGGARAARIAMAALGSKAEPTKQAWDSSVLLLSVDSTVNGYCVALARRKPGTRAERVPESEWAVLVTPKGEATTMTFDDTHCH